VCSDTRLGTLVVWWIKGPLVCGSQWVSGIVQCGQVCAGMYVKNGFRVCGELMHEAALVGLSGCLVVSLCGH
jgi:hypothetical protein